MKFILITILFIGTLFGSDLGFISDYNEALKQAKVQNKDVYMFVSAVDCGWCKKFEEDTLDDDSLIEKIEETYIILHVIKDFDDIPEKFQSKRVPKHFFLTQNGEEIHSFLGYWNIRDFTSLLADVEEKKKKD